MRHGNRLIKDGRSQGGSSYMQLDVRSCYSDHEVSVDFAFSDYL